MNKHRRHHSWQKFRLLKPWYFLLLTVTGAVICVSALRANNEHMVSLRNAVYSADQQNGNVSGALQALQAYVTRHMNTNLSTGSDAVYPPIQLKYTYDRLVRAQSDQIQQTNIQLYTEAQKYCEQQDSTDFSGHNRVPCIEQYVQAHDTSLPAIPDALYKFDFVSPVWSPDLAGWSMAITVLFGSLFVISFAARKFTQASN